jgi:tellurite resistance protein TerB
MLGIFGKKFKKASAEATAAMSKNVNRDLMQAVVYGAIFIAAADGDLAESELKKTEKLIANNPLLKGFGAELSDTIDRAEADFKDGGRRILRQNAEKELSDLKHSPEEAKTVMNIMLTIADEGGIDDAERKALEQAAKWLGLNLKDFED